jgi:hypothetical protein
MPLRRPASSPPPLCRTLTLTPGEPAAAGPAEARKGRAAKARGRKILLARNKVLRSDVIKDLPKVRGSLPAF